MPIRWMVLLLVLWIISPSLYAEDPAADKDADMQIRPEDMEVILLMETLQMMELVERMEMIEDMDMLLKEAPNDDQD